MHGGSTGDADSDGGNFSLALLIHNPDAGTASYSNTCDAKLCTYSDKTGFNFSDEADELVGVCKADNGISHQLAWAMPGNFSATIDIECYKSNRDTGKTGSDLCATAAQSINSLTFANKDFTITSSSLLPGDWLDIRWTIATNDGATATAVIAALAAAEFLLDVK